MNKKILLSFLAIMLSSCSFSNSSNINSDISYDDFSEWYSNEFTPHDYIDERDYEYSNKLDKPSSVVSNIDELEAIVDYYAFYKIERFNVKLTNNYRYSTDKKDIKSELNYLYWHSELINGVMGFNAIDKGSNVWEFTYTIYQNAYIDSDPFFESWTDITYNEPTSSRSEDYDEFVTDDISLPICDVATTQQLWYAVEHNYRPNPIKDSPAEFYYSKAKELLRTIVDSSMSYLEKVTTIYDYISHHSTYDYSGAYLIDDAPNPSLYPDVYCSGYKCFYIEGFFDNGLVVCDGFSKIYTLLGKMEGIDIVRASGTSDKSWSTREVSGHAYCFIKYNDIWYLSDLTWGQHQSFDDKRTCTYYKYMFAPHSYISPYVSNEWQGLGVIDTFNNVSQISPIIDFYKNKKISIGGINYSSYLDNENATLTVNALLNSNKNRKDKANSKTYFNLFVENNSVNEVCNLITANGEYDIYKAVNLFNGTELLVMSEV